MFGVEPLVKVVNQLLGFDGVTTDAAVGIGVLVGCVLETAMQRAVRIEA